MEALRSWLRLFHGLPAVQDSSREASVLVAAEKCGPPCKKWQVMLKAGCLIFNGNWPESIGMAKKQVANGFHTR